jgi:UDP-N-acetylglucosamine:LPS N-acetylglucosamine transferase
MAHKTVVLYPSLGVGHLNPMVELAKLFLRRAHAVVIAVVNPPDKDAVSADAIARLASANPAIAFRLLPVPPSRGNDDDHHTNPVLRTIDVLRAANAALRELLRALPAVDALVVDMFCVDALDVAADLAVPAYFFFASAVGDLAVMLHLPYLYPAAPSSFKDMGTAELHFPGVPPIRALDMSTTMLDRESDIAKERLRQYTRMPEARGFLANSFDWLESRALEAIRRGLCTPGRSTPPVYCIGPLVLPGKITAGERHPCLEWLDAQPERSVVFLCFGSLGTFSAAQLGEVARGLQKSGHRFLWVVRTPPEHKDESVETDLFEGSLPEGFLEETADRGFVVKNWAPQAEVLQHRAIGAFVTHCGWNSVLEGIVAGVPMICWPLYAEQRMNKVHVVEEMKVGVAVEGYEEGIVKAEEVEAKVRLVMASDEGNKLRKRLPRAKKMAADALKEGGSSVVAFEEFLRDLEKCSPQFEKGSI